MASRTLRAEIDIPNKDLTIRPGMFANARILAILPECVVLPTTALVRSADGAFAFVVEDGKAKRVDVRLGRVEGDLAEVTGMRANPAETTWQEVPLTMEFIASGATTLAPGQAVMTAKPDSK
jgi:membrane fusion protein (multidrug efflux system)